VKLRHGQAVPLGLANGKKALGFASGFACAAVFSIERELFSYGIRVEVWRQGAP
jgi:hypothetical protein